MPVLEVTQLRLTSLLADDAALLQSLSTVRAKLQTSSQFYMCIEDPSLVYILGIWSSLSAHEAFLASPERDDILGPQEDMLQFEWTVHVELGDMTSLPLDAPILAIERVSVQEGFVGVFEQAAMRHAQLAKANYPLFKTALCWRCDAAVGCHEAVIFSAWESVQAHTAFEQGHEGNAADEDKKAKNILVHHAWNLEHQKKEKKP